MLVPDHPGNGFYIPPIPMVIFLGANIYRMFDPPFYQWEISRILKWRYVSTICLGHILW